jgi:hypothetical protein
VSRRGAADGGRSFFASYAARQRGSKSAWNALISHRPTRPQIRAKPRSPRSRNQGPAGLRGAGGPTSDQPRHRNVASPRRLDFRNERFRRRPRRAASTALDDFAHGYPRATRHADQRFASDLIRSRCRDDSQSPPRSKRRAPPKQVFERTPRGDYATSSSRLPVVSRGWVSSFS